MRPAKLEFKKFYLLVIPWRENKIPPNLLGDNPVEEIIKFDCQQQKRLAIHPDAFKASREFTLHLLLVHCNLDGMNFSFLKDFRKMISIQLNNNTNIHRADWESLPPLPALYMLLIKNMKLDEWTHFPTLDNGLRSISLSENFIGDGAMDRIIQWLIDSKSADTLVLLDITSTHLTAIPRKMFSLKMLKTLLMDHNPIKTFQTNSNDVSVAFGYPRLSLFSCKIDTIDPDVFQGDFNFFCIITIIG